MRVRECTLSYRSSPGTRNVRMGMNRNRARSSVSLTLSTNFPRLSSRAPLHAHTPRYAAQHGLSAQVHQALPRQCPGPRTRRVCRVESKKKKTALARGVCCAGTAAHRLHAPPAAAGREWRGRAGEAPRPAGQWSRRPVESAGAHALRAARRAASSLAPDTSFPSLFHPTARAPPACWQTERGAAHARDCTHHGGRRGGGVRPPLPDLARGGLPGPRPT